MNKKTKVSVPVNVAHDEAGLFKLYLSYKFLSPKVKYIKSAFVTSSGLVCGGKGLIKECCHYEWEQQPKVCFAQALGYYADAREDAKNLLVFDDDETYLLIHHPWHANYYHWLNETLYRLWIVKDCTDQMVLLLPPKEQLSKIALDSLQPFNFKKIVHIPAGKSALVRTLCMPAQKPKMESYKAEALLYLNKIYVDYFDCAKKARANFNGRIFISRKNSSRRKILNEEEVVKIITQYDFNIVYCEECTFFEQVSLFSNTKFLMGNHGAGLTNMLFMPPGSTVFEFHKRKTNPVRHQNLLYWYMADALGHKYYQQICEPLNIGELFFTADIVVDIDVLKKNLAQIFPDG